MHLIHQPLPGSPPAASLIRLPVDRLTLAKRRWRGVAEDGAEFGFDLDKSLADGAAFYSSGQGTYIIAQKYEPVLEVSLGTNAAALARLGWMIGNLHFQIEVTDAVVRVVDDPAVRQMFEREGVAFTAGKRVFHPLSGGHQH